MTADKGKIRCSERSRVEPALAMPHAPHIPELAWRFGELTNALPAWTIARSAVVGTCFLDPLETVHVQLLCEVCREAEIEKR